MLHKISASRFCFRELGRASAQRGPWGLELATAIPVRHSKTARKTGLWKKFESKPCQNDRADLIDTPKRRSETGSYSLGANAED